MVLGIRPGQYTMRLHLGRNGRVFGKRHCSTKNPYT